MKPYYEDDDVTIFHADCRDAMGSVLDCVIVTDPPYPNNAGHFTEDVDAARTMILRAPGLGCAELLTFWSELEQPQCPLPIVAVHIWHRSNVNGRPYEPILHFSAAVVKRRSEVYRLPAIFDGAGPGCVEYLGQNCVNAHRRELRHLKPEKRPKQQEPTTFWTRHAACFGYPTEWFFPEHGFPPEEAFDLCRSCPVIEECRREGRHEFGLWGGEYHSPKKQRGYRPEIRCMACDGLFFRSGTNDRLCDSCLEPGELRKRQLRDSKRRERARDVGSVDA